MSKVLTHRQWETTDEGSIGQCIEKTKDALRLDAKANDVSDYDIHDNGIHQLPSDGLITLFGGTIWIKAL